MATQFVEAIRARKMPGPKTVLGFFAGVTGIAVTGTASLVWILSTNSGAEWLIPWIVGFAGLVILLVLTGIFVLAVRDPSKLLLTQVSGGEYVQIQRGMILGDSLTGERMVSITDATAITLPAKAESTDSEGAGRDQ